MNIEQKENYIYITSKSTDFGAFFSDFELKYSEFEKKHLIIEISDDINISENDISLFLKYAEQHQTNGTTFVVVKSNIDVDNFPEWFNIVPTLQEAEDVLEMEEIQRDLGF